MSENGQPGLQEWTGPHDRPVGAAGAEVLFGGVLRAEQVERAVGCRTDRGNQHDCRTDRAGGVDEVGVAGQVDLGRSAAEESVYRRDDHRRAGHQPFESGGTAYVGGHDLDLVVEKAASPLGVSDEDPNLLTPAHEVADYLLAQQPAAAGHHDQCGVSTRTWRRTASSTVVLLVWSTGSR